MRRKLSIAAWLLCLVAVSGLRTDAQARIRIQFPKGRSSVELKGSTGKFGITYLIRAKSGQKLVLDLSPASKVGVKVETVGRYGHMVLLREERGGHYEIGLEEAGEYTIFIGSTGRTPAAFDLKVAITRMTDI